MESLLIKYKPKNIDDFNIDNNIKKLINIYINNNQLNFIITGNLCTGKSSLAKVILKKYYKTDESLKKNMLTINLLKDQGINYYRNELKNFCQVNNYANGNVKKTILIEDIEYLNESCQQILNSMIVKYKNINFIITSFNLHKIHDSLIQNLEIINIKNTNNEFLKTILDKILNTESITLSKDDYEYFIKSANFCIPILINNINTFLILNYNENNDYSNLTIKINENYKENIVIEDLNKYFKLCDEKDYGSFEILLNLYNKGYSVIDILDNMFNYVKFYSSIEPEKKYLIIKLLCKYIYIFNDVHEDSIELIFLTNNIINL